MQIDKQIVKSVKDSQCILFLGARASAASPGGSPYQFTKAPPSGSEVSRRLAERCQYPYEDVTNLQRVSLYYQFRPGGSRQALVQAIIEEMTGPEIEPSPALHMLAALPFPMVITTNYDHLFDIALARANTRAGLPKEPMLRIYDPSLPASPERMRVPHTPTEERPVLLKLHGDINSPESIVVTEEDYLTLSSQTMGCRAYTRLAGQTP